ncbi:unnamed protein product [Rangifer tarandus platyrhynchus]|uniref:Uncharacterized protein n=2 Tax=Rangifer tarandus platyrhynchus TaxID=3082113 RepID=A0AC59ZZM1_RANTA|nr:unnamed protein product [Rangifer tarandus platyrhynchus]
MAPPSHEVNDGDSLPQKGLEIPRNPSFQRHGHPNERCSTTYKSNTDKQQNLTNRLRLQQGVLRMYDGLPLGHIKTTLNEEIVPLGAHRAYLGAHGRNGS